MSEFQCGRFSDLLGAEISGVTFDGSEGITLSFTNGMILKMMDSTRRDRIIVMLPNPSHTICLSDNPAGEH